MYIFCIIVYVLVDMHLVGLVEVAGDPGGVAEDEDHDDGEQQHGHRHVAPVPASTHHLGPDPANRIVP